MIDDTHFARLSIVVSEVPENQLTCACLVLHLHPWSPALKRYRCFALICRHYIQLKPCCRALPCVLMFAQPRCPSTDPLP